MDTSDVALTVAELAKLTAEVAAPAGPGEAPITKRFNAAMVKALRAGNGRITGELSDLDLLVLTSIGRKSRQPRACPLGYFIIDGQLLVIASMGGSDQNPQWFQNILSDSHVSVELNGKSFDASAEVIEGRDRDRIFDQICQRSAVFSEYQQSTSRRIPVVKLVPHTPVAGLRDPHDGR